MPIKTLPIDVDSLRMLMARDKVSVSELAQDIEVDRGSVHHWLKHGRIPEKHLDPVAQRFRVETAYLRHGYTGFDRTLLAGCLEVLEPILARSGAPITYEQKASLIALLARESMLTAIPPQAETAAHLIELLLSRKAVD